MIDGPKGGRPAYVYGRRGPADKIDHEVAVTDFALRYLKAEFSRDGRVGRATPDLTMVWRGRTCFVEIDLSENMAAPQMAEKWNRYGEAIDGFVLVVCRTEGRLARLVAGLKSTPVRDYALFTTFDRLTGGRDEPWVDAEGVAVRI